MSGKHMKLTSHLGADGTRSIPIHGGRRPQHAPARGASVARRHTADHGGPGASPPARIAGDPARPLVHIALETIG